MEPPWLPVDPDAGEPREGPPPLSIAKRLSTATQQVAREPSAEPYWNEMRIMRTVTTLMAIALTVVAVVLAVMALPFGWVWLPPTLALILVGGFAMWFWVAQHEADQTAKRIAEAAQDRQFRAEAAENGGRVQWG